MNQAINSNILGLYDSGSIKYDERTQTKRTRLGHVVPVNEREMLALIENLEVEILNLRARFEPAEQLKMQSAGLVQKPTNKPTNTTLLLCP